VVLYFIFCCVVALGGDPAKVEALGFHQPIGDCEHTTVVKYFSLYTRYKHTFLCPRRPADEFSLQCTDSFGTSSLPPSGAKWYKICGTPHESFWDFAFIVVQASILGAIVCGHIVRSNLRFHQPSPSVPKAFKFD